MAQVFGIKWLWSGHILLVGAFALVAWSTIFQLSSATIAGIITTPATTERPAVAMVTVKMLVFNHDESRPRM